MSLKRDRLARRLTLFGVLAMGLFLQFIFTLGDLRSREWAMRRVSASAALDLTPRDQYPAAYRLGQSGRQQRRAVITVGKRVARLTTIHLLPRRKRSKSLRR